MRVEQATAKVAPTQGGRCGACRRRGEGTPPYGGVVCLRRVVGDADPYDIGKTPVGRGQRAPLLRVLCVVSAAHTGAALRMHNKGYGACQTGGREGRPYA